MPSEPARMAETAPHPMPVRGMPTTTRGDDSGCAHEWTIPIETTWCLQCMWCFEWIDPDAETEDE